MIACLCGGIFEVLALLLLALGATVFPWLRRRLAALRCHVCNRHDHIHGRDCKSKE
jgi:hypothetical protein